MKYYKERLMIPAVNDNDEIIGPVERWEAHKKGVLHRGFTLIVWYNNQIICQHRKHPVFDGVIDFTASSHPILRGSSFQEIEEAAYITLEREWGLKKNTIKYPPTPLGKIRYKSSDGVYTEHEICHFYATEIDKLPSLQTDYAYGFSLLSRDDLKSTVFPLSRSFAPWVKECLRNNLI